MAYYCQLCRYITYTPTVEGETHGIPWTLETRYIICDHCFNSTGQMIHEHPIRTADPARIYPETGGHFICGVCDTPSENQRGAMTKHCTQCEFGACQRCTEQVHSTLHEHRLERINAKVVGNRGKDHWSCQECQNTFCTHNKKKTKM